jgi:hypothetical protein
MEAGVLWVWVLPTGIGYWISVPDHEVILWLLLMISRIAVTVLHGTSFLIGVANPLPRNSFRVSC